VKSTTSTLSVLPMMQVFFESLMAPS
jgi:hypothetical protein